jgi:pimeloyl-ACP methyl ester carboxylesterase
VLVHGFGATHDMMLRQYEDHFASHGIAVLAFDFRHLGASDGQPRQRISMHRHRQDVNAALDFIAAQPEIDPARIGLWGTSLGAMHALRVAASRNDLAAVVVQCPIVHGLAAARSNGVRALMRVTPAIAADMVGAALGRERHYIPVVGPPGTTAVVTVPGALAGWTSTVPAGDSFDNRVADAGAIGLLAANATRLARNIRAPLLVCVSDRETLMPPGLAERVARRAQRGVERHYDTDHFGVYHPPFLEPVRNDQTAFLQEHLRVER